MEIKKILWPNDLSKCSEESIPHITSLAEKYGAMVYVLYVAEDLVHHKSWYGDFGLSHINKIVEREKEKAAERHQKVCQKHLEDCAAYSRHIVVGDPAKEILDFIGKEGIDMVVMCRKGEKGNFDMGSVAQKVVSNSPVPVVMIPNAKNISFSKTLRSI